MKGEQPVMSNISREVENFIHKFKDLLYYQHKDEILSFLSMLQKNNEYGTISVEDDEMRHFTCCPWHNDECTEGPDTCLCSVFYLRKYKILNLIKLYKRLYSG